MAGFTPRRLYKGSQLIKIFSISADDEYVLTLYSGASADTEIGKVGFSRNSAQVKQDDAPIQIPIQAANTKISAKLAAKSTNARTCTIKLYYHEYPDQ